MESEKIILYDSVKAIISNGFFSGSIISKCRDPFNSIIFSDNLTILEEQRIKIKEGLKIGFEPYLKKKIAFSRKNDFSWDGDLSSSLEYSILIPEYVMELFDEGQFSESYPFTINLLHTAGLYLKDEVTGGINHLDFVIGEIIKNPICSIENGIIIADRVVIDDRGDPVFYDCIIVGRDLRGNLSVSYEPLVNVDDKVLLYVIILGRESLRE